MIWGIAAGSIVVLASYWARLVTLGGALAMFCLAVPIFGYGGWMWTVPIVMFFLPSSLLSKVGKAHKRKFDLVFEKSDRRDAFQVMANGGVAGAIAVWFAVTGDVDVFPLYCTALAAASADTWATELGTLAKGTPRLITSFRQVPAGTSGGITVVGLMSSLAGALVVALSGWLFVGAAMATVIVALCGLAGSLIDSLLGATVQAQYRCGSCEKITERREHCGQSTEQISGWVWMNNDWVNFWSIAGGTGLASVVI
ncbi:MAG: DUF92 domain-containing protein [Candidatus Latescibacteria bacterium]|jgi:uncharacterized protein (TIGR00297 family)|nr:DUF92 domain-containing protein [Candidatus Latescibacterota bacterium]